MISSLRAMRIDPSFFSSSKFNVMKNVKLASTLMMVFYFLPRSSSSLGWLGLAEAMRSLTPSESGLASSRDSSFTSKKKLMLEQFLKGMFMVPFEGILIILNPVFQLTISFRQTMLGTQPRLVMGMLRGANSSICRVRVPLISVETSSSGIVALIMIGKGSFSLIGTSICVTSSPPSTSLKVNTSPCSLTRVSTLIDNRWNYFLWDSVKKSISQTLVAMNLWEQAKMGYLLKLILFFYTCRHYLVAETMNECLGPCGLGSFIFYFPLIMLTCRCCSG